jgi:hypothetical protein
MSATIAIELAPADVASPDAQALLGTCTVGTQARARCVFSEDAAPDDDRIAVASVTWDGPTRMAAHVEAGLRGGVLQPRRVRELSFSSLDPEIERWRTVGFAIATLVGDLVEQDADVARRAPTPTQPAPAQPVPAPVQATPMPRGPAPISEAAALDTAHDFVPRWWLDALFSAESGAGSAPAFGGEIDATRMLDRERWFLVGGVHVAAQSLDEDRLLILRPDASLGAGLVALELGQRLRVTVRVEAMLELVHVAGTDPTTGLSAQSGRWLPGLAQGLDGVWMGSRTVGLVAGVGATETAGAVDIMAHGQLAARIPAVHWVGQGGLRLAFP